MPNLILNRYLEQARAGRLERDAAQEAVVRKLDALRDALDLYRPASKSGALGWLFGGGRKPEAPRGLYIWGSVGRGKTMLMDFFFQEARIARKRRVHFHAFMAEVHAHIHQWRQARKTGAVKGEDPVAPLAGEIAERAWLLCFDEFAVTDIADAMILGRLFEALFARGVVVVATSNVDPVDLYKDGLNRALFLPFIGMIREKMDVLKLDARTDFRLEKLSSGGVYHTPLGPAAAAALDAAFEAIAGAPDGAPVELDVVGRKLAVPQAVGHVARFGFADLCRKPLGPNDFLAIAENFHTVVVDDVPVMTQDDRNAAKRFITFIDACYDQNVKLVVSAAATPTALYTGAIGRETFEFDRTASRLIEMQSHSYLALPHGRADSRASGDATGLVET